MDNEDLNTRLLDLERLCQSLASGLLSAQRTLMSTRIVVDIQNQAIRALASTHPEKKDVAQIFQAIWNERRGILGDDDTSDDLREAAQGAIDGISDALETKIL